MNRERARELLPIIQAFAEGKDIEWRLDDEDWDDVCDDISNHGIDTLEYRIKPEPRIIWLYPSLTDVWLEPVIPDEDEIEEHGLIRFVEEK